MSHVDPLSTRQNRDQYSFWRFQYSGGLVFTVRRGESFCFPNLWINRWKHADTLGAAPPQWVFYPLNFLIPLQLATCPGSYQIGICITHTHTLTIHPPPPLSLTHTWHNFYSVLAPFPLPLAHWNTLTHTYSSRKAHTCEETYMQAWIQTHSKARAGNVKFSHCSCSRLK